MKLLKIKIYSRPTKAQFEDMVKEHMCMEKLFLDKNKNKNITTHVQKKRIQMVLSKLLQLRQQKWFEKVVHRYQMQKLKN